MPEPTSHEVHRHRTHGITVILPCRHFFRGIFGHCHCAVGMLGFFTSYESSRGQKVARSDLRLAAQRCGTACCCRIQIKTTRRTHLVIFRFLVLLSFFHLFDGLPLRGHLFMMTDQRRLDDTKAIFTGTAERAGSLSTCTRLDAANLPLFSGRIETCVETYQDGLTSVSVYTWLSASFSTHSSSYMASKRAREKASITKNETSTISL